jgi:sugar phosphate isomerase/epimerase
MSEYPHDHNKNMDRRHVLKTLAGVALTRIAEAQPPAPAAPAPASDNGRRAPLVVAFSQNLIEVEYPELGDIVKQMGFDGVDLTVRPGGHVEPRLANVDLVRAFEVMSGSGLVVPVITTALTTPADRTAVPVIALAGMSGAKAFRTGGWSYAGAPNLQQRLGEVQRDFATLMTVGRQYTIAAAFYNGVGDSVGAPIWDVHRILEPLDPAWAGFYFDIGNATAQGAAGAWETALRLVLPRLKAVSVQDFIWEKQNGRWQMTRCPLGEGMVDWTKFFQILAQANYTGPLTIEIGYTKKDMPSALIKDLQFARKQVAAAWPAAPKT